MSADPRDEINRFYYEPLLKKIVKVLLWLVWYESHLDRSLYKASNSCRKMDMDENTY